MLIYLTENEIKKAINDFIENNGHYAVEEIEIKNLPHSSNWLTAVARYDSNIENWNAQNEKLESVEPKEDGVSEIDAICELTITKQIFESIIANYINSIGLTVEAIRIDLSEKEIQKKINIKLKKLVSAPSEESLLANACMWYRHDFGLLSEEEQSRLIFQAKEWRLALTKAGLCTEKDRS